MDKMTWEQYYTDILQLAENLGDYRPDIIAPCMLGGLIPSNQSGAHPSWYCDEVRAGPIPAADIVPAKKSGIAADCPRDNIRGAESRIRPQSGLARQRAHGLCHHRFFPFRMLLGDFLKRSRPAQISRRRRNARDKGQLPVNAVDRIVKEHRVVSRGMSRLMLKSEGRRCPP